jgi:acetyltransferase-like isoleucine patch superfamily enzyme
VSTAPLQPSSRAPGLLAAEDVEIAADAEIGGHVVLHAGVRIGRGCVVQDGAVLGKPRLPVPNSRSDPPPFALTSIADGAAVGAGAVLCAGATVSAGAVIGDHVLLREGCVIGRDCVLGHGAAVGFGVRIGARVMIRGNSVIAPATIVEDDVFIGPSVMATDHNALGRDREHRVPLRGATLRRGARIGAAAVLLPGVEIGEEAVVGAGSVVTRDVPAGAQVMGSPARQLLRVTE